MHALKVVLAGVGETLWLRYRTIDRCMSHRLEIEALKRIESDGLPVQFTDDFGLSVKIERFSPVLVLMLDLFKTVEADIEIEIEKQKIGQRMVQKAQSSGIIQPVTGAPNGMRLA